MSTRQPWQAACICMWSMKLFHKHSGVKTMLRRLVKMEIRSCLDRAECRLVFGLYMILSVGGFLLCLRNDVGSHYQFIRSADDNFLLMGTETSFFVYLLVLLFPVLSMVPCSFSCNYDVVNHRDILIAHRCGRKAYVVSKFISSGVLTFVITALPLLINLAMCHIIYPSVGYDNVWGEPQYLIGLYSYSGERFLSLFQVQSPFLYNLFYISLYGLFASLFSLFACGLCLVRASALAMVQIPVLVLVGYHLVMILSQWAGYPCFALQYYLLPEYPGTWAGFLTILAVMCIADGLLLRKGIKSEFL